MWIHYSKLSNIFVNEENLIIIGTTLQNFRRRMKGNLGHVVCTAYMVVAEKSENNFTTTTIKFNFSKFTDTRNRTYTQLNTSYMYLKFLHLHQNSWYNRTGTGFDVQRSRF